MTTTSTVPTRAAHAVPAQAERRRPLWKHGVLAAVDAYAANITQPALQEGGPVAHFPVQLPSHGRPQGVCPFPHGKSAGAAK